MSERLRIENLRDRYSHYGDTKHLNNNTAVKDIRVLLEVLDNLYGTLYFTMQRSYAAYQKSLTPADYDIYLTAKLAVMTHPSSGITKIPAYLRGE